MITFKHFYENRKDAFYIGIPYVLEYTRAGEISLLQIFRMPAYQRVMDKKCIFGVIFDKNEENEEN